MSPLERLGVEVAAYQLLGSRTQAAMLCALVNANGRPLSVQALAEVRPWLGVAVTDARNVIKTRICLLRESMADVGLGGLIQTTDGGYCLPAANRPPVVERLTEAAR